MFIPVCTWCPTCNSDIFIAFPFCSCTLAVDGKQAGGGDGGGEGGGDGGGGDGVGGGQYNSERCCHNQHNKVVDNQLLPTIHHIEPVTLGHLTYSNSAFDQAEEIHKQTI